MLKQILMKIKSGSFASVRELAESLALPVRQVEMLLEQLEGMGYIEKQRLDSCDGRCAKCTVGCGNVCMPGAKLYSYTLTEKGQAAVRQEHAEA